jgi:hypothetical protein
MSQPWQIFADQLAILAAKAQSQQTLLPTSIQWQYCFVNRGGDQHVTVAFCVEGGDTIRVPASGKANADISSVFAVLGAFFWELVSVVTWPQGEGHTYYFKRRINPGPELHDREIDDAAEELRR